MVRTQPVGQSFGYLVIVAVSVVMLFLTGCGGEDDAPSGDAVQPTPSNAPIAEAGPDQTVLVGTLVTLDGSKSVSGTSGLLTYQWTLTTKPVGSAATLAGATTARPTFTADVAGTYTAQLVVNNGAFGSQPDTVTITAGTGNLPPVADAGTDGTALLGTVITLDGTNSSDPNGTPVTYAWRFISQPPTSQAVLSDPTSVAPSFTPDVEGTYRLSLTVSDGALTSEPDEVEITLMAGNSAPVADAGVDQQVSTGQVVTLSGAGSTDPNGDPLTYSWQFQSKPARSTAALTDATTVSPTFTPDLAGFYVVSLIVSDGLLSSPLDTVVIELRPPSVQGFNGPVTQILAAQDASGDVYVLGDFTSYRGSPVARVVRLRPDGALHPFAWPRALEGRAVSIALADDGSRDLYVAELAGEYPDRISHIWKVHEDGTRNAGFIVGTARIDQDFGSYTWEGAVHNLVSVGDGSGRIYATVPVGFSGPMDFLYNGTAVGAIVRLNPDGSLDRTFSAQSGGPVSHLVPAQDGTGDMYIISWVRHSPSGFVSNLRRLNPDGTLDTAFQATGHDLFLYASVSLMVPVGDGTGDIFAVGFFPNLEAPQPIVGAYRGLVRMNPDGTMDLTSPKPQVDPDTSPSAVVKASDGSGDWLVGLRGTVLRFKPSGTIDSAFTTGETSGNIDVITPAQDHTGAFYVGGKFSSYNGVAANNFVRINRNGTLD